MCERKKLVPIPGFLRAGVDFDPTHPEFGVDSEGRECFRLDECIVPAVEALWTAGIVTIGCCCGDGSGRGVISLRTERGVGHGAA